MPINDMLVLSTGGRGDPGSLTLNRSDAVIRLFPVWRRAQGAGPAAFQGLRVKGAFVVSAAYDDAGDEVHDVVVASDAGGLCAVLSPWTRARGPGAVLVTDQGSGAGVPVRWDPNDRRGAVFRFATVAGGAYSIDPSP